MGEGEREHAGELLSLQDEASGEGEVHRETPGMVELSGEDRANFECCLIVAVACPEGCLEGCEVAQPRHISKWHSVQW